MKPHSTQTFVFPHFLRKRSMRKYVLCKIVLSDPRINGMNSFTASTLFHDNCTCQFMVHFSLYILKIHACAVNSKISQRTLYEVQRRLCHSLSKCVRKNIYCGTNDSAEFARSCSIQTTYGTFLIQCDIISLAFWKACYLRRYRSLGIIGSVFTSDKGIMQCSKGHLSV